MARTLVASDTFDSSIDSNWANGEDAWTDLTWVTGGHIELVTVGDIEGSIRRSGESYNNDQYSTVTVQALDATDFNAIGAAVRGGIGPACYIGYVFSNDGGESLPKYNIFYVDSELEVTVLASSGTPSALSAGHTITLEVEGTTLRLYTDEGSGEALRLTTTDANLTAGSPRVFLAAASTASRSRVTAWQGGNITGVGLGIPIVMHHRRMLAL